LLRSKLQTDEGRAELDKAREAFQRRLSAATSASGPAEIDWAFYKARLGDLDVDALQRDFTAFLSAIPPQTYEEGKDKGEWLAPSALHGAHISKSPSLHSLPPPYTTTSVAAAHETKEAAWTGFASFCASRIGELAKLEAEQRDHKLHRWYRRARLWQRFPGLYETLHNKARGTWDNEMWGNYIAYKARLTAVPWDPTVGDLDDAKRKALNADFAAKSGLDATQVAAAAGKA